MPLEVGDVVQVTYESSLSGQTILNILHYKVSTAGITISETTQLGVYAAYFANPAATPCPLKFLVAALGDNQVMSNVKCQRVFPTRGVYVQEDINSTGTQDPAGTPNIALSVTKRTRLPGRKGIGRVQVGGLPNTAYVNGILTAAYSNIIGPLLSNFALPVTIALDGSVLTPVVYGTGYEGLDRSEIFQVQLEQEVRTMHRRTVGLGI